MVDSTDYAELAAKTVADAINLTSDRASQVMVRPMVRGAECRAGPARAADGADLLVAGSRGYGGFAGALLSSVSQHCTHHAHCPVVIMCWAAREDFRPCQWPMLRRHYRV
jgi:nucleotide-binding universal stress UspA family protein